MCVFSEWWPIVMNLAVNDIALVGDSSEHGAVVGIGCIKKTIYHNSQAKNHYQGPRHTVLEDMMLH
jgi:hypothetical protein